MNIILQFITILLLSVICHVLAKLYFGDLLYSFCKWKKFQQFIIWYMRKYKKEEVSVDFNGKGFAMWNSNHKRVDFDFQKTEENWYVKTIISNKYFN